MDKHCPCQICKGLHEVYLYALLTKCEVKMAGYWQSSFAAFSWTETKSRSKKRKEKTRLIFSRPDRISLVNIPRLI